MPLLVLASGSAQGSDAVSTMLLTLVVVLLGAKLAGDLFKRLGQPAVLAELIVGIVLGNLTGLFQFIAATLPALDETCSRWAGRVEFLTEVAHGAPFEVMAELGAILLLFYVGLEATPKEMLAVGGRATLVASVGVVTPMILGYGVGALMHPRESWMLHAFLGAMLAATSVGITARVLQDAGAVRTPAARIILGAAVIDDVMGLIVLAVISGVISAAVTGTSLHANAIVWIILKALAFLIGSLAIGSFLSPRLFRSALALKSTGIVQTLSLSLCFALAYTAQRLGLAPIVGAFAAGLVLEEVHFEGQRRRGEKPLHETLEPLIALMVPVFFVRMGMLVDVGTFTKLPVLGFAALLTLAAIVGKLVCGFVVPKKLAPLAIGIGMMPRGEVGLIFAGIGAKMIVDGQPVINAEAYAAAVFMVVVTTMATPPLLIWALRRARLISGG